MKKKKIKSKLDKTTQKLEKTKSRLKSVMHELDAMHKRYGDSGSLDTATLQGTAVRGNIAGKLDSADGDLQSSTATH